MSSIVVVDTSIAIKWVISEDDSSTAAALLASWIHEDVFILAPPLLAYELTNVLYQRLRKGSITLDEVESGLRSILLDMLELDTSQDVALNMRATRLAHQFSLPASYDAHYLALAERKNCEFWTADARLLKAVRDKLPWVRTLADYRTGDKQQTEGKDETL